MRIRPDKWKVGGTMDSARRQRDRVDILNEIAESEARSEQLLSERLADAPRPHVFTTTQPWVEPLDRSNNKNFPLATGVLDYFPDALREVAYVSKVGNEQHNPGEPLHWAKEKSTDEADALVRHLLKRGTYDTDGVRHTAKVAWRALALLQREIEAERL